MRRVPVLPTLLVLIAVGIMVALGLWQLDRRQQKEALLARYASVRADSPAVAWPIEPHAFAQSLFRRATIDCRVEGKDNPVAGHNAQGATGWAHAFACVLPNGARAEVLIGWSRDLTARDWQGGTVTGTIAPGASGAVRLIADPPLAGLAANARPDPRDVPNNHLSYAVQWFLFAGVALVIYALALRKRLAASGAAG